MWKMSQFYFPCIDAADPKADYVFVIRSVFRNATVYDAPYLVEGFVEMGCLMNYALRFAPVQYVQSNRLIAGRKNTCHFVHAAFDS